MIIVLVCPILFLFSCEDEDLCLIGNGTAYDYELNVDDFEKIKLSGPVNLALSQGEDVSVTVIAEPEIFDEIDYSVRNNQLKIGFENNVRCFETELGVWVHVTLPDLQEVSVSGTSTIISEDDLNLDKLKLKIDGTGDITLNGSVESQVIKISGSANINNIDFSSNRTEILVDGSADVDVAVSSHLEIEVNGGANIRYSGQPEIDKNVSGNLTLSRIN